VQTAKAVDNSTGIGDRKVASAAGLGKTRKSRGKSFVKCQWFRFNGAVSVTHVSMQETECVSRGHLTVHPHQIHSLRSLVPSPLP